MRKYKYKVVKRINNKSCIINDNSPFSLEYKKDTNIFAKKDTLGVMVFNTKRNALDFIRRCRFKTKFIIKRVIPIGRGVTPKSISRSVKTEKLKEFYKDSEYRYPECAFPFEGTMCYPGVYVVD